MKKHIKPTRKNNPKSGHAKPPENHIIAIIPIWIGNIIRYALAQVIGDTLEFCDIGTFRTPNSATLYSRIIWRVEPSELWGGG